MKYLALAKNTEVAYWIGHNLKNYLEVNPENMSEIEHIIDFLHSGVAPKRLKKMSYSEANESAKRWVKTMVKKGVGFEDVEHVDYDVVIDFKDGFKLVKLKTELAFVREGSLMAHCVSSYFNKDSDIYSLRDSRNMPHCTLEISDKAEYFNQCKGKGNGPVHHKYISYILDTMKHFDIEIRDSEMIQLGYLNLDSYEDHQREFFLKHFKNTSTFEFKGKRYYYVG
jgi:hypothetical protein